MSTEHFCWTIGSGRRDAVALAAAPKLELRLPQVLDLPEHLEPFLGPDPRRYVKQQVWIYSNPIYVE